MKIILSLIVISNCLFAQGKKFSPGLAVGIGYIERTTLFKTPENDAIPIPFISWNTENFYFRGLQFGYFLYQKYPQITFTLQPVMLEIENTVGTYNENLSKRYRTLNAGIEASFPLPWVTAVLHIQHDILNVYQGWTSSFDLKKRLEVTSQFSVTPGFQLQYFSENYVDYYFGVDFDEIANDRPSYSPKKEITFGPILMTMYQLENQWNLMFLGRHTMYGSEFSHSPLVKRNDQFSFIMSATKNF